MFSRVGFLLPQGDLGNREIELCRSKNRCRSLAEHCNSDLSNRLQTYPNVRRHHLSSKSSGCLQDGIQQAAFYLYTLCCRQKYWTVGHIYCDGILSIQRASWFPHSDERLPGDTENVQLQEEKRKEIVRSLPSTSIRTTNGWARDPWSCKKNSMEYYPPVLWCWFRRLVF